MKNRNDHKQENSKLKSYFSHDILCEALPYVLKALIVLLFFAVHLYIATKHEAWRDEAQSWLLVKNLSFRELIKVLPSEGHPILWFLILKPLILCGVPFKYLCVFTTIIVTIAVAILLYCVKLPFLLKVCVIASNLFIYQNPIISRSYSVVVLIIVLIIAFWDKRYDSPILFGILIALLLQSHIIFAGMGCGLLFIMIVRCIVGKWKDKRLIIGAGIAILSLLFLPLELLQSKTTNAEVVLSADSIIEKANLYNVRRSLLSLTESIVRVDSLMLYRFCLASILSLIVVSGVLVIWGVAKKSEVWFDCSFVTLSSISAGIIIVGLLYEGRVQMRSTLVLATVLFFFAGTYNLIPKYIKSVYAVIFVTFNLISFKMACEGAIDDINDPLISDSMNYANFISETLPENSVLLVTECYSVPPTYAYLSDMRPDILVYSIDKMREYTAHYWGETYSELTEHQWNNIVNLFIHDRAVYYWNCSLHPTAPRKIIDESTLLYDNLANDITDGNQLYRIR